ncbi:pilus assembly protein PilO [Gloeocapsopsis dulcis]|uniref:Pilus assembly protein PilO n=1 Tax=Gloeocapsopsis dulcis AAB1 = 1H9 TaxID=1433147 RepID=A0A6N8FPN3_9CHRO|nr:pilus assembly protein PilO [Gloeocapsopsis dulcis]MUL35250.1 pilus assembly protein PilO [Gloeocapsopsis dulcis AAB1 = 1H9]WNN89132.1 pilus assembly protein PilO [Gloeocapsopsis dulcis]
MTITEDFIPEETIEFQPVAPIYPKAFGVTLTPGVSGVLIALLGLAGSVYLVVNLLMPTWQRHQELQASRDEKNALVTQKQLAIQQTEQVRAELAQVRQQNAQVLTLFADERTLDTLLLDLNRVVESGNAQLPQNSPRARLKRFVPINQSPEIISDGSLGSAVNGKLKRQAVNIELEGTFEQTQAIIRNIERLQPLLIVKDYQSSLAQTSGDQQAGVIQPGGPVITTSFQLEALMPASPAEAASAASSPDQQ